ncbi:hypothetical protein PG984_014996 [Apiospora sp. TS-2023a]
MFGFIIQSRAWSYEFGRKRIAVVNSFSAAGGNKLVLIEEPPVPKAIGGVPYASNLSQMDPGPRGFEELASTGAIFHPLRLPAITLLLEKVVFNSKTFNTNHLRRNTREMINYFVTPQETSKMAMIDDDTLWIEMRPHLVCANFVTATLPSVGAAVPSQSRNEDITFVANNRIWTMCVLHKSGLNV